MFISSVKIRNFRLFDSQSKFDLENVNIPDGTYSGSGMNLIVGENACGKTSLLEAIALPLLEYRAESFSIDDFSDHTKPVTITLLADKEFEISKTTPKGSFPAKGFLFDGRVRTKGNKAFLSSIVVSDQKIIPADGETIPDYSPDLRLKVDNPFKGSRFSENDIIYLDKNRIFQTRTGSYNPTRFDRLMEDFNYQYIKEQEDNVPNINNDLVEKIEKDVRNNFLKQAIEKFKNIGGPELSLQLVKNYGPYKNAFFAVKNSTNMQIPLDKTGSGFEMIFALLYSFYMARQSRKQQIILVDEPELHLHPKLQEAFVAFLLDASKNAQVFCTTQSPLFVKHIHANDKARSKIIFKNHSGVTLSEISESKLPYLSANEINFVAFKLPTEEYHNELYEELKIRDDSIQPNPLNIKDYDIHFFQNEKGEAAGYPYNGTANQVSTHTYLRTQIHHRGTSGKPNPEELKSSIEKMRSYL